MGSIPALRSHYDRLLAVAAVEWRGILRSHPFRLFLPAGALLVLLAPHLVLFAFDAREAMIAQLGVSTAAIFATLCGLAAGAGSVAGDRESLREDLVRSRSIPPAAWIFGKWLGIAAAVTVAALLLGGVHLLSLALGGGPPHGYVALAAAIVAAAVGGALAGALALAFSAVLRPGPAFLGSLLVLLAGHGVALAADGSILALLLPRVPELNLASEAAFGALPVGVFLFAVLHGIAWSLFAVLAGAAFAHARSR